MNSYQFSFEKLVAWQEAKVLAKEIYQCTQAFPADEKFGMVAQMRRAGISVCANISEGSTRSSAKDQAHFTTIAYGSLIELLNHLIIAVELGYMKEDVLMNLRSLIQPLSIKLSNLKKAQLSRLNRLQMILLFLFSYATYAPLQPLIP